jgi:hypothetical protein
LDSKIFNLARGGLGGCSCGIGKDHGAMNERIQKITGQVLDELVPETWVALGYDKIKEIQRRTAELIIAECTAVLFDESERLSGLYSEEDNWDSAEEYEICSDQCIDNIALIEKHFGVEQ